MSRLSVATIQSGTPMPLRNYKLENNLIGLPLLGLPVQEAVLDQELLLHLNVGGCSLFVQHLVESCLECFSWCPQVFGNLIEDWVLLLFLFQSVTLVVASLAGLASTASSWQTTWLPGVGLTPCSTHSSMGMIALLSTAFTPGYGIWFKYS